MPRLSGKKWSNSRSENNAIAKRLMQISLKVDDYVYKHKPISERDAEMYIQEVSSYKLKCSQDVRSLQVIEKLTRCMKSIIVEHQELNKSVPYTKNNGTFSAEMAAQVIPTSPIYSLPDEDRTHLTQNNINEEVNNTNVIDTNYADIAGLCINDKINIVTTIQAERHSINDADTKREFTSLSLEESAVLQVSEYVNENCSQSILNNHDNTECMLHDGIESCLNENREVNTTLKNVVNNTTHTNKEFNTETVNFKSILSAENNIEIVDPEIAQTIKPLVMQASEDKALNANWMQESAKSKVKVKRNATPRKKTDNKGNENIKNKKSRKKTSKKTNTTGTLMKSVENKSDKTSEYFSNKHKYVRPQEKLNVTSPANIYNENIENDLSWIENIRYVREVSAKEFDQKLADVDQGFLENFTLPHFLDDQDFVYSP